MKNRERLNSILGFLPVDRLPVIEPFKWWDVTLKEWLGQGMPAGVDPVEYFGLDKHHQIWYGPGDEDHPERGKGEGWHISSIDEYRSLLSHFYPGQAVNPDELQVIDKAHTMGDIFFWITLEGFFWWPRVLLGIEKHLYSFHDNPELLHIINSDLLEFNRSVLESVCEVIKPDFITLAEDMSYRSGPMIGRDHFDEFLRPYYLQLIEAARNAGVKKILVDTDGDFTKMVDWFHEDCGLDGFLPCERQAGMDLVELRGKSPKLNLMGGFDKMVMSQGESAIREEFEKSLPALKTGGIVPGTDHQVPPDVSLNDYRIYVSLLREYAAKAAE